MACNKLHITNIPPGGMNEFALSLYLERVMGDKVHIAEDEDAVQFNDKKDEAIVHLSQPISEATVRDVNDKNNRAFKKRVLIIQCAPHCVRMSGLSPKTSKEVLQLYFEQKEFGGGENPVAFMKLNNSVATVGFVAEEVCSRVVAEPVRKIDKANVKLERCAFAFSQPATSPEAAPVPAPAANPAPPARARPLTASRTRVTREASTLTSSHPAEAGPSATSGTPRPVTPRHPRPMTPQSAPAAAQPPMLYRERSEVVKEASVTRHLEVDQMKYKLIKHRVKNEIDQATVTLKEKKDATKRMVTVELSGLESKVNAALVVVYESVIAVKEIPVSLEKEAMTLVCKNLGRKLQQLLDQQGIAARISAKPGAGITAFTLDDAAAVTTAIKDLFSSATIPTKGTSFSRVDWPTKKFQLEMSEDVVVKESKGYLQVHGYKHAVNDAKVAIECILQGSKMDAKTVPLEHENVFRYFAEVRKDALDSIKRQFTDINIECVKSGPRFSLSITGKATSVKDALPKVQQAVQSIKHGRYEADKEGMAAYFTEGDGSIQITSVEKRRQCAITALAVSSSGPTAPTSAPGPAPVGPLPVSNSVQVVSGNIVETKADMLVNCVASDDRNLDNCGALSQIFHAAGGQDLQDKFHALGGLKPWTVAFTDPAGSLACKTVCHLSVRDWQGASSAKQLVSVLEECLVEASKKGYRSVAFPAVGCGNWKYPVPSVAHCFAQASQIAPNIQVQVVVFKDQRLLGELKNALGARPDRLKNLKLRQGDITKAQSDALVCSVCSEEVDLLRVGMVGKAFAQAGGQGVAQAFSKIGGLRTGSVFLSKDVGSLQCKAIVYVKIDRWAGDAKALTAQIMACLQQVVSAGGRSVVFPTLGCGALNTPPRVLAECFMQAVQHFTNVDVTILAFKKDNIYHEIEAELLSTGSAKGGSRSTHGICPNLSVERGDIVKTKADILVNSVAGDSDNLANCGAVSAAFCKAGGTEVAEAFTQNGGLDEGDVLAYDEDMGQLQCQVLVHCSVRKWANAGSTQLLRDMIEYCVNLADENSLGTIAFPTLGCGQLQYPVSDVCSCFLEVARLFPNVKITVVAFDQKIFGEFQQELMGVSVGPSGASRHSPSTLRFFICAGDTTQCQAAKQDLQQFIATNHTTESINDEMVKFLPFLAKYRQSIEALPAKYHVRFIDVETSTIKLTGLKYEILDATVKIKELLQQARQEKTAALVKRVLGTDAFLHFLGQEETRTPRSWPMFGGMTQVEAHKATQNADATQFMKASQGEEEQMLANLLAQAWEGPGNVELVEAFAIYNPLLYCQYHHRRKAYFSKCVTAPFKKIGEIVDDEPDVATATFGLKRLDEERIPEINEYFFFHGTNHDVVNSIVSQNLDFRLGNSGLYGQGAYLAESASKSHQYTDEDEIEGINCMFVVKAPLGRIFYSEDIQEFQRPPCAQCLQEKCAHNDPFDCVLGANVNETDPRLQFREFIIYEKELTYPAFLLKYKVCEDSFDSE